MNLARTSIIAAGLLAASATAWAAGDATARPGTESSAGLSAYLQVARAESEMTDGEVRKVDKENNKVTVRHGEIKSLDMPPMTMVFKVQDPAGLDSLKAGDKVRFSAEKQGDSLVITKIESKK